MTDRVSSDSQPRLRVFLVIAFIALLLVACTSGTQESANDDRSGAAEPRPVYAAIGASETAGIGSGDPSTQAWPQVLHAEAFPEFRIVNLGISGATVENALVRQLPEVQRLQPEVVTAWLNVNDLLRGVSPDEYGRALTELLEQLQDLNPKQVLVANTPPLGNLPALRACAPNSSDQGALCFLFEGLPPTREINELVASYNAVIERAVTRTGGTLVDLHSAGLDARREGSEPELISGDGFHPSTEGHAAIAEVFAIELDG